MAFLIMACLLWDMSRPEEKSIIDSLSITVGGDLSTSRSMGSRAIIDGSFLTQQATIMSSSNAMIKLTFPDYTYIHTIFILNSQNESQQDNNGSIEV